jgi:hypothetical protein
VAITTGTVWAGPRPERYAGAGARRFAVRVAVVSLTATAWYAGSVFLPHHRRWTFEGAGVWVLLSSWVAILVVPLLAAWCCWHGAAGAWCARRRSRVWTALYVGAGLLSAAVLLVYASGWNRAIVASLLE